MITHSAQQPFSKSSVTSLPAPPAAAACRAASTAAVGVLLSLPFVLIPSPIASSLVLLVTPAKSQPAPATAGRHPNS